MREDERLRLMYYLGEGARLGRNEDDGQNYTTTKTAEAISQSLMRLETAQRQGPQWASVRAADIRS